MKDISEWGVPEWRTLLQGQDDDDDDDDDGVRSEKSYHKYRYVVSSHEDDVYYARYVIKGGIPVLQCCLHTSLYIHVSYTSMINLNAHYDTIHARSVKIILLHYYIEPETNRHLFA